MLKWFVGLVWFFDRFFWCGAGYQSPCVLIWQSSTALRSLIEPCNYCFCYVYYTTWWWFQIFFIFTPNLGKIPILTNTFQMGWNHQPVNTGHYPRTNRHGTTRRASWKDKHLLQLAVLGFRVNFRGCSSHKVIHLWGLASRNIVLNSIKQSAWLKNSTSPKDPGMS